MQETQLDLAGCARLLQVPLKQLQRAVRGGQFPDLPEGLHAMRTNIR
jgi:hypothetical protein